MELNILTLFPEMFAPLKESIISRACDRGIVKINIFDIRDFTKDKHKKCDDTPYGGGAGMVMTCQPIFDCFNSINKPNSLTLITSPRGKIFNQKMAEQFAKQEIINIVCGHYEGVDERIISLCNATEVSVGDYVLTGGELPAMIIADTVLRLVEGVIKKDSLSEESFSSGMLEYPQYTKPAEFNGLKVPEILLSGNHQEIDKWRKQKSLEITKKNRPDLLKKGNKNEN